MRLLILSDLHLEHGVSLTVPAGVDYDLVILAGDINSPGTRAVHWAARESTFGGRPVIYVPGNHELYGREIGTELQAMREAAEGTSVHVLSRDSVMVQGVRFLGAMLWTDFALPVCNERGPAYDLDEVDVARALELANRYVNDFRCIELLNPTVRAQRERPSRRVLRAEDTLAMHWVDRDWLRRQLEVENSGPTVVVTHHAPHRKSVAQRYRSDWLSPAFASDLPELFFGSESLSVRGGKVSPSGPALWVHGHTHAGSDYQVGRCRVVSNPRGYRMRDGAWENAQFDPGLSVEIVGCTRHEGTLQESESAKGEREQLLKPGPDRPLSPGTTSEHVDANPETRPRSPL